MANEYYYDGLVSTHEASWYSELAAIRALNLQGKKVSILGMDSPDTSIPPAWMQIMQLREAFVEGGARSVDYVYYEDESDNFQLDF